MLLSAVPPGSATPKAGQGSSTGGSFSLTCLPMWGHLPAVCTELFPTRERVSRPSYPFKSGYTGLSRCFQTVLLTTLARVYIQLLTNDLNISRFQRKCTVSTAVTSICSLHGVGIGQHSVKHKHTSPRGTFCNKTHRANSVTPSSTRFSLQGMQRQGPLHRAAERPAASRPSPAASSQAPQDVLWWCSLSLKARSGIFPVYSGAGPILGYVMVAWECLGLYYLKRQHPVLCTFQNAVILRSPVGQRELEFNKERSFGYVQNLQHQGYSHWKEVPACVIAKRSPGFPVSSPHLPVNSAKMKYTVWRICAHNVICMQTGFIFNQ